MKKIFYSLVILTPAFVLAQVEGTITGTQGPKFGNPFGSGIESIPKLIETIANNVILPIGAVIVVVMVIYSGFLFVTAQGNESKLSDAKKAVTYTVIGAVILLGSWVIANVITETVCLLYEDPPAGLGCGTGVRTVDIGSDGLPIWNP